MHYLYNHKNNLRIIANFELCKQLRLNESSFIDTQDCLLIGGWSMAGPRFNNKQTDTHMPYVSPLFAIIDNVLARIRR